MGSRQALRLLGATVMACIAMGALAGSAQAYQWIVEGKVLPENVHHGVSCTEAENELEEPIPFVLTGSVGANNVPVEIEFEEVTCKEWEIWNTGGQAYSLGKLEFKAIEVLEPKGCEVVEPLTTNPLTGHVAAFPKLETETGITYLPAAGFTNWAVVKLQGAECAIAGLRPLKGMDVAEVVPGVFEEIPTYVFSKEVEELTAERLTFAGNLASFDGELQFVF